MLRLAIFGFGFVGHAVACSYYGQKDVSIVVIDPDANKRQDAIKLGFHAMEIADEMEVDAAFVCVPTPEREDGSCDDGYLRAAVRSAMNVTDVIICKSTAPVGVYESFDELRVAYVPEFLRQESACTDYISQKQVIVGACNRALAASVATVMQASLLGKRIQCRWVARSAAVYGKYVHNVSLAVKLAVMNEMYGLACARGIPWHEITQVLEGTNAGGSHTKVPGPDRRTGFGGACFPKDLRAAIADFTSVSAATGKELNHGTLLAAREWIQKEGGQ